jgi:hypothetical protein
MAIQGRRFCEIHQNCVRSLKETSPSPLTKPRLLDIGIHGCVYQPPIPCLYLTEYNRRHQNDTMKLMHQSDTVMEEEISEAVRNFDPKGHYFVPLMADFCTVNSHVPETQLCPRYHHSEDKSQFRGYFVRHRGRTLQSYITTDLKILWQWIIHLLRGIKFLHSHGIVHMGITIDHIIIDLEGSKLTNFGNARFIDDHNSQFTYDSRHPLFFSAAAEDATLTQLYQDYEELASLFSRSYVHDTETDIISDTFDDARELEYFDSVIEPNIRKVDIYMLFDTIRSIVPSFSGLPIHTSLRKYLIELINRCTDINYHLQYNVDKALTFIRDNNIENLVHDV